MVQGPRVRYEICHVGLGLVLDVARGDLGHVELPGLWSVLRSKPIRPGELRCLVCEDEGRGVQWVYLRDRPSPHPVHFTTTIRTHGNPTKGDEHIALQERVAACAERHGLTATVEARSTDGAHISDVLISGGGIDLGFEAQLSPEDRQKTRRRNAVRVKAGIQPMWVGTNAQAAFVDAVPWAAIPRQRAAYIAAGQQMRVTGGVQKLVLEDCGFDGNPCPRRRRKARELCSSRHLYPELVRPDLDELVVGAATGYYRSLEILGARRTRYWWLTAGDYERWLDDRAPDAGARSPTVRPQRSRPPTHHLPPARTPPTVPRGRCGSGRPLCDQPARLYPAGWRCDQHRPSSRDLVPGRRS